ncbi:MAG TPA: maleylpyruvate isomerase family mycothiol-dependent enzyme [Acidimicrobiales bacterium]|nr:maleylpyruvate isomerase family mycothiol-dependent enzyme [Acidimicrobiales bacterium]
MQQAAPDHDTLVDELEGQGARLAAVVSATELDAPVPTCPGWVVRDLVRHTGGVHRWATAHVALGRLAPVSPDEADAAFDAPDDDSLLAWFVAGHAALVTALRAAGPERPCWSFLPGGAGSRFWARRQLHETAIHRVDAESTVGDRTALRPELAADGIDELVRGFFSRPRNRFRADPPIVLAVRCTDAPGAWSVRAGPEGSTGSLGESDADCTVTGPANDCYELLWNRRSAGEIDVAGDPAVLGAWGRLATVTWS